MSMVQVRARLRTGGETLARFAGSKRFFYGVMAFFVAESLWIVFSARYPLAFDEEFHFGLIQLHASQWLPFFTSQPPHADAYGSVVRDPSYLYHFLMSVPYRLIRLVTINEVAQIIVLRVCNVALFAGGLVLFRRLLLRLHASRALIHTALLIVALIPIVPYLAAHINYDNLFILLTAWIFLIVFDWLDDLVHGDISLARSLLLAGLIMLACLVKYAFLPVALGLGLCMIWRTIRAWQQHVVGWRAVVDDARHAARWPLAGLLVFLVVASGLFIERYGINLIRYRTPNPDCGQVLDVDSCVQYGPWGRDYILAQTKPTPAPDAPPYIKSWLRGMWQRSFFAISNKRDDNSYDVQPPLPVPAVTTAVIGIMTAGLCVWYGYRLIRRQPRWLALLIPAVLYIAALFIQTYQSFERTGVPVAINGRYLIPFLPVIFVFGALAFGALLRGYDTLKAYLAVFVVLLMLQGGGTMTFILRSRDDWLWQNPAATRTNDMAREILQRVTIGSQETDLFPIRP